jgi:hypothetical protein
MNDHAVTDDGFLENPWVSQRERFLGRFAWVVLAGLGFLVFDLTAHPSLGVAVFCLKFGLERFKTAFWLKKIDPNRKRAWTCFCFYSAGAMLRIGITSMALTHAAMIFIEYYDVGRPAGAAGGPPFPSEMIVASIICFLGFMFWWLIEIVAIVLAHVFNVKIWVGSVADRARKNSVWPPSQLYNYWRDDDRNWAKPQIILVFSFLMAFFIILILIASFSGENGKRPQPHLEYHLGASSGAIALSGLFLLTIYYFVKRRILASTPLDCWPENDPDPVPSLQPF